MRAPWRTEIESIMNFLARSFVPIISVLLAFVAITSCGQNVPTTPRDVKKTIGFAQSETDNPWRLAETRSMQEEAAKRSDRYDLIMTNAQGDIARQASDVEELIARRVDAIFLVPREENGLSDVLRRARDAKIPVFLIDREHQGTPGVDFVTFIGSNFFEEGQRLGQWVAENTGGSAGVVVLEGNAGSSVARDRSNGFREVIDRHPGIKVLASVAANFKRPEGRAAMEKLIDAYGKRITVVYAHNDDMALGAIQALKAAGMNPGRDVKVVSVDGQRSALEAIMAGDLNAVVECNPRVGAIAFDTLDRYFRGESIPAKIIVPDRFFDASNAAQFVNDAF